MPEQQQNSISLRELVRIAAKAYNDDEPQMETSPPGTRSSTATDAWLRAASSATRWLISSSSNSQRPTTRRRVARTSLRKHNVS